MTKIDHLKKVRLEIACGGRRAPFEFVLGAASEGLCPCEYELLHKTVGDRLNLSIPKPMVAQTFAHLYAPLCGILQLNTPYEMLDLAVTVAAVDAPAPREIVRAMAQALEQAGCGGDCGCGCGDP